MKWKVRSQVKVFEARPYFKIERQAVVLPTGKIVEDYYQIIMPKFTSIIARNRSGKILVFKGYRHGVRKETYSFPGGAVESKEEIINGAKRELLEETGYEGKKWFFHGSFVGDASKQCGTYYIYTAADLKKITEPNSDDLEDVKTLLLTEKELMKIALSCSDSSVSLGFLATVFFANNKAFKI